jgi:hypothetical protein
VSLKEVCKLEIQVLEVRADAARVRVTWRTQEGLERPVGTAVQTERGVWLSITPQGPTPSRWARFSSISRKCPMENNSRAPRETPHPAPGSSPQPPTPNAAHAPHTGLRATLSWLESQWRWHRDAYEQELGAGRSRGPGADWHFSQYRWFSRRAFLLSRELHAHG